MAKIIAVAGKGGVGKTTLTGLMIQYLCKNGKTPILAVDADANSNLNEVLGVEAPPTLGEIREEIERAGMSLNSPIPAGMAKGDYLQMRLEDAITEEKDFDLMVMGRTQGQGCYCFVNGLVQTQIQRLQANYPYLVVDNEAGIQRLLRIYSGRIPDFKEAAVKLGGILIPGGDAAVELELFDNLYIRFLLWEGDEEFPASSQILFSSNFPAAFSVYDLTEIVEIILGVMKEKEVQK